MSALARKLLEAAAEGDEKTARSMAGRGANLNVLTAAGETALILAAKGGHAVIALDLVARGAELEPRDARRSWTALMHSAARGSHDVARALLEKGACVSVLGKDGETPLMLAALFGHTPVVEALLEYGAEVDQCAEDGKRGLTHACYKGYWATALCLVSHGASLDAADCGGRSPIAWAAFQGHAQIVRFLAERGASIEIRDIGLEWSPLMLASHGGHLEAVKCLADRKANLEARGSDGETAIMLAALKGHAHVVQFLASHGAEVDAVANDGMTAVQIAAEAGHFAAAEKLVEYGAEVPEDGLAINQDPTLALGEAKASTREQRRQLENPGGVTLTIRLAKQLIEDFEEVAVASFDERKERSRAAAERWGFTPTELGYRRMLRVVEEAGADAERLKSALHDADALMTDPARDGMFDWDEMGGVGDEDDA
eukprot:gnl/TRDRNA2_/TRDRNA2_191173_c0_seq1.p1 gnl/TRDRNA2_/TRDRNA2_191173_c0~~gnl/TRDRNA2_/TRDRNA2_191173_c0_seq1.p1  ORF type:complete len:428 (-),score=119.32 gnl/TRDRNA2_/TRDRNA2_191173_c0_seq1:70-1353(-)